jgi:hypothetical protein
MASEYIVDVDASIPGIPITPNLFGLSSTPAVAPLLTDDLANTCRATGFKNLRIQTGSRVKNRFLACVKDGVSTILATDDSAYDPGRAIDVEIIAEGARIDVYVDGQRVFSVKNDIFPKGRLGVFSVASEHGFWSSFSLSGFHPWVPPTIWVNRLEKPIGSQLYGQNWRVSPENLEECSAVDYSSFRIALSPRGTDWENFRFRLAMRSDPPSIVNPNGPNYQGYLGITFRATDWRNGYRLYLGSKTNPLNHTNNPWRVDDFPKALAFAQKAGLAPTIVLNYPKISPDDLGDLADQIYDSGSRGVLAPKVFELGNEISDVTEADVGQALDHSVPGSVIARDIGYYRRALQKHFPGSMLLVPVAAGYRLSSESLEELFGGDRYLSAGLAVHLYPGQELSIGQKLAVPYAVENGYLTERYRQKGLFRGIRDTLMGFLPKKLADSLPIAVTEYQLLGADFHGMSTGVALCDLLGVLAKSGVRLAQLSGLGADDDGWAPFDSSLRLKTSGMAINLMSGLFIDVSSYYLDTNVSSSSHRQILGYSINGSGLLPPIDNVPFVAAHASRLESCGDVTVVLINRDLKDSHGVMVRTIGLPERRDFNSHYLRITRFENSKIFHENVNRDPRCFFMDLPPLSVTLVRL